MPTTLLIHGDGPNGSTAIVDEVGHGITVNGNAQISTAQSKFGGSSLYFDGTGDYISIADSTDLTMGSSDFTIEGYVRFSAVTSLQCIFEKRASFTARGLAIFLDTDSKLYFNASDSSTTAWEVSIASGALSTNTWYHFAFTRSGSSWRAFIDGAQVGSTVTATFTVDDGSAALQIGTFQNASGSLNGYLDEIRITKDEALYTANFTPPSQRFFFQDTVLLLHGDGANGSTAIKDETGKAVTVNGNAQISTAQSKFGGSSLVLDGTGDYLYITGGDLAFGTGDFTVECWVRAADVTNAGIWQLSAAAGGFATTNRGCVLAFNSGGGGLSVSYGSTDAFVTASLSTNTWHHVAMCRNGTTLRVFVDGVQKASFTDSTNYTGTYLVVGGYYSTSYLLNGYIDDLRICRSAKYTANFTPPIAAHDYEYTTLLIHADGANAATCVRDETGKAVTVNGNAQISTAQSKFGGSSLYFDGTGDYLSIAESAGFGFGSGDFTIEAWVYHSGGTGAQQIIGQRSTNVNSGVYLFLQTGSVHLYLGNGTSWFVSDLNMTFTSGQWWHLAIVRSGSSVYLFKGGVLTATASSVSGSLPSSAPLYIGIEAYQNSIFYNGYLDELRISKGIARYTANFTPPPAPFTLLGHYTYTISGTVKDDTGANAARTVRLYRRDTGALVGETSSNGTTGAFSFSNPDALEYYLVALDDAAGTQYNALIFDKVVRG